MLTEYFTMCSKHIEACQYLYREFPEHYVWDRQAKCWTKRKKGGVIGRINGANPVEGERYYLRLLLNHVRGPTSFDDLLTFEGITYLTFKEAAQKRGFLESDESIADCLTEAVTFQTPEALRRLFAIILVYCEPSDVKSLWDTNFKILLADFKRIHLYSTMAQLSCTLESINSLEIMGKNISNYDLPSLKSCPITPQNRICREIDEELSIETPQEDLNLSLHLNVEQKSAYHLILETVLGENLGAFFVDGPGGTGKTYLYRALLADIRNRGMVALATATSGMAASIMPGGRTAHSRFKIAIQADETSLCNISKQSGTTNLIRSARLIIWDEAPMAKRFAIEMLDQTLKDLMANDVCFGGKVIVFGGDFHQVFPVVRRGTRVETVNASLVKSTFWPDMQILGLKVNIRAKMDTTFGEFLLRIGNGHQDTNNDEMVVVPDEIVIRWEANFTNFN